MKVLVHGSGERFTLLEPVHYPEEGIVVPAGFVTDFASVPKVFWSIFPPAGWYHRAAVLHDYLYTYPVPGLTRWEADAAFRAQMKRDGVGRRTRYTLWLAVRLFGARFFRG